MKRVGYLALLALAGCGSAPEQRPAAVPTAPPTPIVQAIEPDLDASTELAVSEGRSRIRVGDPARTFTEAFPMPQRNAGRVRDLPPTLAEPFSAVGWERDDESEGAGAILYGTRIAAVLHQRQVEEPEVVQQVERYTEAYGSPIQIGGPKARYWFWEREPQLLMVSAYEPATGPRLMATALGEAEVMAQLGATPQRVRRALDVARGGGGPENGLLGTP